MAIRFSLGFATFRDATRGRWTAVANLLTHPAIAEVVVVDNEPGTASSAELKGLAQSDPRVRYFEYAGVPGTSQPRNAVFEHATNDHVICVDSHVFLLPGAVDALAAFYEGAGADCPDLVHGPLFTERGTLYGDLFNDQWRGTMWGTWGVAWRSPNGTGFSPWNPDADAIAYKSTGDWPQRELTPDDLGVPAVGGWAGHEGVLESHGCVRLAAGTAPYRIPGMGFGAFACRRDAWLSRPFHREMKGFGGEELSHHCGVRAAGRNVWCVPGFRWWHDFHRVGTPYPASAFDTVRNLYLQARAYGYSEAEIVRYFVKWQQNVIGHAEWERYVRENRVQLADGRVGIRDGVPEHLRVSVLTGQIPTDPVLVELAEHHATSRKLPYVEWKQLVHGVETGTSDWPHHSGNARFPVPPGRVPYRVTPEEQAELDRQLADPPRPAPELPPVKVAPPPTLEALYKQACETPGDITAHLPKLRELASKSAVVVELGVRHAVSATAILAGQPKVFIGVDLSLTQQARMLATVAGRTEYKLLEANSETVELPQFDLCHFDTDPHDAARLMAELTKHAPKARRWLAMHDTETFGLSYDGRPGLLYALHPFLKAHPEFKVVWHDKRDNGFTVLSRNPEDFPEVPVELPPLPGGVGTELKAILASLSITPAANCRCNAIGAEMDFRGVATVKAEREYFLGALRENSKQYGWGTFIKAGANALLSGLAFKVNPLDPMPGLLDEAIRRAEAKAI